MSGTISIHTSINFKNKTPLSKSKKQFFVFFFISAFALSAIFFFSYIRHNPIIPSKYPRVNITFDNELTTEEFADATFELVSENTKYSTDKMQSKIRLRGSAPGKGVDRYPKKGYRIELSDSKSLLGMREDDDWLLFAMYLDFPRMKIKLAMELWRSLLSSNPTAILPDSRYVIVYTNGEFQGLYLLAENNDALLHNFNLEKNGADSSIIIQIKGFTDLREYDETKYELDWPNIDEEVLLIRETMMELIYFLNELNDTAFFDEINGIYSKFLKINLIDFYIFNFFILHEDFWRRNYFILRNSYQSLFYLNPWDFDHCFGLYMGKSRSPNKNPEEDICILNMLYARLLSNKPFREACNERWNYLRTSLWTEEFILDLLSEQYEEIILVLDIEIEKWKPQRLNEKWSNDVNVYVSHLFEWIPDRLKFCDLYFEEY